MLENTRAFSKSFIPKEVFREVESWKDPKIFEMRGQKLFEKDFLLHINNTRTESYCLMDIKQKIHDALLNELLKKDENGKYINLIRLVRHGKLTVRSPVALKNGKGYVDVVVAYPRTIEKGGILSKEDHHVAFELITDLGFDAGKKGEQLNRYQQEYKDTRAIIPEEYKEQYEERFRINSVVVHAWKGIRRWKCKNKECEKITSDEHSSIQPSSCSSSSCGRSQLYFVGFESVQFE